MNDSVQSVTVDESNVDQHGFFCYKSKPNSPGYQAKLRWLRQRFAEGLRIQILYKGRTSAGFIEVLPGEYTWRVVDAPGTLVVHCLWVVGRRKNKGYGARLLEACLDDARQQGNQGVVMVSSRGIQLADETIFLKNGFERIGSAPPSFSLLYKRLGPGPAPAFPGDWERRLAQYAPGATIVYADQCLHMPDTVQLALDQFAARGIAARVVRLETAAEVRAQAPSAYGVCAILVDGQLLAYHYLGSKELRRLDGELLGRS